MKFKVGDKVKFLNATGGGKVIRINIEGLVFIEDEDGFEIPIMMSELLKINETTREEIPVKKDESEKKNKEIAEALENIFNEIPEQIVAGNDKPDSYLGLFPLYQGGSFIYAFDLYLINNSNYKVLYSTGILKKSSEILHIDSSLLDANSKVWFYTINHKDLNDPVVFIFQHLFYQTKTYLSQKPLYKEIRLDPLLIFDPNELSVNEFFNTKAILFKIQYDEMNEIKDLTEKEISKVINEKEMHEKPAKKPLSPDINEVDLHIEELVEDHSQLSKAEILDIQMSRFKFVLETAIRNNEKKIVFIHGIGQGTLRYEIRKYIDSYHPKFKYQDASFKEYGYGATMVIIK